MGAQIFNSIDRKRKSYRVRMSAKASEEMRTGLERIQEMKRTNRAPGTVGFVAFAGDDQRRTTELLNHASRGDTDYATMPAISLNYIAERLAKRFLFFEALPDGIEYPPFLFLAIGIQLIEPGRDLGRSRRIFHCQKINHIARYIHASRSVDAGSDSESHLSGVERTAA